MKLDLPKLESYSLAFAEKVCAEYYQGDRGVITGSGILKLTPSEQINYFIIKNLFERWKDETARLRSPFFDFEQDEVKDAMTSFMNKLSRHISVRKEFFKPLLTKAVSDALAYINQPLEFLKVEFCQKPILSLQEVKEKEKYFRFNKVLVQNFLKKLQLSGKTGFSKEEALQYLSEVYKNYEMSLEPSDKFLEQLHSVLKLPTEDTTPSDTMKSGFQKEEPKVIPVKKFEFVINHEVKEEEAIDNVTEEKPGTLNDFLTKGKQLTLNQVFVHEQDESLLSKTRKSKIHDLRVAVPINLKYIFINELFRGSADDYNLAISQVERCTDLESAVNIIDQLYSKKYEWDKEKSEVKEFFELLERRFY
jgi:hypothetical protein